METLIAAAIGILAFAGLRLLWEARTFPVLLGTVLLSHAVNLFLFASGRLVRSLPPVLDAVQPGFTDPLPQALVLTAIVISFGMTAVVAAIALAARLRQGDDRVEEE